MAKFIYYTVTTPPIGTLIPHTNTQTNQDLDELREVDLAPVATLHLAHNVGQHRLCGVLVEGPHGAT